MYEEAARTHGAATGSGDYRTGNKASDLLAAIYSELRRRGEDASDQPLVVDSGATVASMLYDAFGNRVLEQTGTMQTAELYDGGRLSHMVVVDGLDAAGRAMVRDPWIVVRNGSGRVPRGLER